MSKGSYRGGSTLTGWNANGKALPSPGGGEGRPNELQCPGHRVCEAAMSVELNHTIVHATDREATARFMSEVFGLPEPEPFGPFLVVRTANDVSLDYIASSSPVSPQHYAFLVSEAEFDAIFGRVKDRGLAHWADPARSRPGEINTRDGGRGVYFCDPSGHFLEILTRPYGSGG
jgi:catechol 2,3-dioxygenase-like lactoylglutathione lyase family enzyme